MPELAITSPEAKVTIPWYYNVSSAVGTARANQRVDVKLVQYLLKRIYAHPSKAAKRPAGAAIVVDGVFGPTTGKYIVTFQLQCGGLMADGIVDHANANRGSISHLFYAILAINQTYEKLFGDLRAPWVRDPGMDSELAWSLFPISLEATSDGF